MAKDKKKEAPVVEEQASEALAASVASSEALAVDTADEWDFGSDAQAGFKGLMRDEFSIPFYGLLQSNSEIVKKKLVPGAEGGLFLNSMTNELVQTLIIQPVCIDRVIVEWAPRGTDKKVVGRHKYHDDIVQKAIARNNGSIISTKEKPLYSGNGQNTLRDTRYLYFQRLAEDGLTVIGFGIMGFSSTKIGKLNDATSAINQSGLKPPMWSGRFVMTAQLEEKGDDSWHNVVIRAFGRNDLVFSKENLLPPAPENPSDNFVPSKKQELYISGRELEKSIKGGQRKADFEQEAAYEGSGPSESEDAKEKRHF